MRISVVAHGKLQSHKGLRHLVELLKAQHTVQVYFSQSPGDSFHDAKSSTADSDLVIAAGGDGTLHEVVNGAMLSGFSSGHLPKLALFPLGTGNDFARSIGATSDAARLVHLIKEGRHAAVDVLQLDLVSPQSVPVTRYCINVCDVGIGGEVAQWLHRVPNWLGADLKYMLAALLGFLRYRSHSCSILQGRTVTEGKILSFIMANGRFFASGMGIAPQAQFDDGQMATVCFGRLTVLHYLYFLPAIKRSQTIAHPEVRYSAAEEVTVKGISKEFAVDIDGEFGGFTPLKVRVLKQALQFVA